MVSGNYFGVLGVQPAIGRAILPRDEEVPGRNPVAVLSYHYWQSTLAGDPSVVGRSSQSTEFHSPSSVWRRRDFLVLNVDAQPPDLWLPLTMQRELMEHSSLLALAICTGFI